jgi:hypothetical protein
MYQLIPRDQWDEQAGARVCGCYYDRLRKAQGQFTWNATQSTTVTKGRVVPVYELQVRRILHGRSTQVTRRFANPPLLGDSFRISILQTPACQL